MFLVLTRRWGLRFQRHNRRLKRLVRPSLQGLLDVLDEGPFRLPPAVLLHQLLPLLFDVLQVELARWLLCLGSSTITSTATATATTTATAHALTGPHNLACVRAVRARIKWLARR